MSVGSRPSGTIATMMPMAKMKAFQNGTPAKRPTAKKSSPIATATIPITRREVRDLRPQRRDDVADRLREVRDPSELGVHAGREDDRPRLAGDERGAREHDVLAVDQIAAVGPRRHARPGQ